MLSLGKTGCSWANGHNLGYPFVPQDARATGPTSAQHIQVRATDANTQGRNQDFPRSRALRRNLLDAYLPSSGNHQGRVRRYGHRLHQGTKADTRC